MGNGTQLGVSLIEFCIIWKDYREISGLGVWYQIMKINDAQQPKVFDKNWWNIIDISENTIP